MTTTLRTQVAVIGAGPAGLLLAALLRRSGIESIVVDARDRADIESTIRAGILEQGTVELLRSLGRTRVDTVGMRHEGIELRARGTGHRIDFTALVDRAVWLYPQHEVLIDLLALADDDGADVRLETTATAVEGAETPRPVVRARTAGGEALEIAAELVVGADGTRGITRAVVNGDSHAGTFREYPFAWFGILVEAPPSAPELIYSTSEHGFALISQRSETVQRMYLQCEPEQAVDEWSDARIWDMLQQRVGGGLVEGPVFKRDVLRFRSFVAASLRRGRVLLAGDAAHTVPPTGAKGMNLAAADVTVLHRAIEAFLLRGDETGLDGYEATALRRIWRGQYFSTWMTSMLHAAPGASEFDEQRRLTELELVAGSRHGAAFLAEGYTGWPLG